MMKGTLTVASGQKEGSMYIASGTCGSIDFAVSGVQPSENSIQTDVLSPVKSSQTLVEVSTSSLSPPSSPFATGSPVEVEPRRSSRFVSSFDCPLLIENGKPESNDEAINDDSKLEWELAMADEVKSMLQNETWELVRLPHGEGALSDHCCYMRRYAGSSYILLPFYVDDILIVGLDIQLIKVLKTRLSSLFEVEDLRAANQVLWMKISRVWVSRELKVSQESSWKKVVERFIMIGARPVHTPLAGHFKPASSQSPVIEEERTVMAGEPYIAVGGLICAKTCTRPGIAQAVGVVIPGSEPRQAVKWVF